MKFDMESFHSVVMLFGGYTFIVVSLSTWLGSLVARKILSADSHFYNEKLEILKNKLEIVSHEKKLSVSRFDELQATALREIHGVLVDLEFFIEDHLQRTYQKWNSAFEKSQKEGNLDPDLSQSLAKKALAMESHLALATGTLEYIAYEAFSKWKPEFDKVKRVALTNEIYIDNVLFEQVMSLIKETEKILAGSVRSISNIALDAMGREGDPVAKKIPTAVGPEVQQKIQECFNELHKTCWDQFREIKTQITKGIKQALTPSSQ